MKNSYRKQLIEQYEDSLFAVVMNDLMQADGVKWDEESQRLAHDNLFSVPETLDKRCINAINHALAKKNRQKRILEAGRIISHVAIVFMVFFLSVAIPFCTASAFRQGVLDLLIEKFEKETYIRLEEVTDKKQDFGLSWLPPGFWEKTYTAGNDDYQIVRYEKETGEYIEYNEFYGEYANLTIDSEEAQAQREFIGNKEVFFSIKDGVIIALWKNEEMNSYCELFTFQVSKSDVLQIIKYL